MTRGQIVRLGLGLLGESISNNFFGGGEDEINERANDAYRQVARVTRACRFNATLTTVSGQAEYPEADFIQEDYMVDWEIFNHKGIVYPDQRALTYITPQIYDLQLKTGGTIWAWTEVETQGGDTVGLSKSVFLLQTPSSIIDLTCRGWFVPISMADDVSVPRFAAKDHEVISKVFQKLTLLARGDARYAAYAVDADEDVKNVSANLFIQSVNVDTNIYGSVEKYSRDNIPYSPYNRDL